MNKLDGSQFSGVVKSCTFKGVHYEMFVDTDKGYELMIQDYNAFEVGSEVGLLVKPQDIQVMHKERLCNVFDGEGLDGNHVNFLGCDFECAVPAGLAQGDKVEVQVPFDKVDLLDYQEEGKPEGEVRFLIYKGDHYHLEVFNKGLYSVYVIFELYSCLYSFNPGFAPGIKKPLCFT